MNIPQSGGNKPESIEDCVTGPHKALQSRSTLGVRLLRIHQERPFLHPPWRQLSAASSVSPRLLAWHQPGLAIDRLQTSTCDSRCISGCQYQASPHLERLLQRGALAYFSRLTASNACRSLVTICAGSSLPTFTMGACKVAESYQLSATSPQECFILLQG